MAFVLKQIHVIRLDVFLNQPERVALARVVVAEVGLHVVRDVEVHRLPLVDVWAVCGWCKTEEGFSCEAKK